MVLQQDVQEKLEKHREEKANKISTDSSGGETKFSNEELDQIASIKNNYDGITLRMGQVHFEIQSLSTEKGLKLS